MTDRPRRTSLFDPHSESFRQLSDVLLVGVFVFVVGLGVITWFAALASAASILMADRAHGAAVGPRVLWAEFVRRVRTRWLSHLVVPTIVLVLLVADALLLPFLVGDATVALLVVWVVAAASITVGLLYALSTSDGGTAAEDWARTAATLSIAPGAVALLLLGVLAALAVVALAPLLIVVMAGPLALAAAAVRIRIGAIEAARAA